MFTKNIINFLLSVLFLLSAVQVWAVPAKRKVVTYRQGDGTSVNVTMRGDEFAHSLLTLDGLTVGLGADGFVYYTTVQGMTSVKAHNADERSADERQFVQEMKNEMSMKALRAKAPTREAGGPAKAQVPQTGSPRIPIILVNFSDIKFKSGDDAVNRFKDHFRTGEVSCYQYFVDQSHGKYTPQFDVLGPVNLSNPRSDYGGNDSGGNDRAVGTLVVDACEGVTGVDFSNYDNDGDGQVDVVIVLYPGVSEAQAWDTTPDAIWPCQWNLLSAFITGHSSRLFLNIDGVSINRFAVFNELHGDSDATDRIDGIGTFCHEYSHCLGLPDFYDTSGDENHVIYGMDEWSLLDYGCYNNDSYTPCAYTAYEREFMGWLTIENLVEGTKYTLKPITDEDGKAYQYVNPRNSNERIIVENRKREGWNEYMSAEGLLINHVDYSSLSWSQGTVNNDANHQRMTLFPADGVLNDKNNEGDLYPFGNINQLSPDAAFYSGGAIGKPITNIVRNADGTVSFNFVKPDDEVLTGDVNRDGKVDTGDVTTLVNMIIGNVDMDAEVADVDGNGTVNVSDVTELVNNILK